MTSEHGGKADRGPLSESMYTACSTQLTTGLACTSSITREYMEHGGRLPPNCALTVYYLPVYPPYSDYNYGLWSKTARVESEWDMFPGSSLGGRKANNILGISSGGAAGPPGPDDRSAHGPVTTWTCPRAMARYFYSLNTRSMILLQHWKFV